MSNIYWVGVRESDLLSVSDLYSGSVTLFGSGRSGNRCMFHKQTERRDHNEADVQFDEFYVQAMRDILTEDPSAQFMFYNQDMVCHAAQPLADRAVCRNAPELLQVLNHKMLCKLWLKEAVSLLPSVQVLGNECSNLLLREYFPGFNACVVQPDFSSGGHSTYLLTEENKPDILKHINPTGFYSVSPYMKNAVSINVHGILYHDGFQLYPPSVQIIQKEQGRLLYRGGDFIAARMLPDSVRDHICHIAKKVSEKLQSAGYLGVYGIDLIVVGDYVYFMEINPRFQASTPVLNYALSQQNRASLNQCCIDAFAGKSVGGAWDDLLGVDVGYSIFAYLDDPFNPRFCGHIWKKYFSANPQLSILADGYYPELSGAPGSYLFRAIYPHNLVSPLPGPIRLAEPLTSCVSIDVNSPIELKTMLICYGLTISEEALTRIRRSGKLREANFSAVDITIKMKEHQLIVNCPYQMWPSAYSPFAIGLYQNELTLFFFDNPVYPVQVCYESPLNQEKTSSGVSYSSVAFLATDRLRINYKPVCYYKRIGSGCSFCNLPTHNQDYSQQDIEEIIQEYLEREEFRHILIGGGSASPDSQFHEVIRLARFLRGRTDKPLYLMSLPPKEPARIKALYEAGISEMAFNIEIFDRALAAKYMPGKGRIPLERYFDALVEAVKYLGNQGNVRSMLIVGFDPKETLLDGVKTLCELGVQPMLSVFRPMVGTGLENWLPPGLQDILEIFERAADICAQYGRRLGPSCPDCQNNTLSLPEWCHTASETV